MNLELSISTNMCIDATSSGAGSSPTLWTWSVACPLPVRRSERLWRRGREAEPCRPAPPHQHAWWERQPGVDVYPVLPSRLLCQRQQPGRAREPASHVERRHHGLHAVPRRPVRSHRRPHRLPALRSRAGGARRRLRGLHRLRRERLLTRWAGRDHLRRMRCGHVDRRLDAAVGVLGHAGGGGRQQLGGRGLLGGRAEPGGAQPEGRGRWQHSGGVWRLGGLSGVQHHRAPVRRELLRLPELQLGGSGQEHHLRSLSCMRQLWQLRRLLWQPGARPGPAAGLDHHGLLGRLP